MCATLELGGASERVSRLCVGHAVVSTSTLTVGVRAFLRNAFSQKPTPQSTWSARRGLSRYGRGEANRPLRAVGGSGPRFKTVYNRKTRLAFCGKAPAKAPSLAAERYKLG